MKLSRPAAQRVPAHVAWVAGHEGRPVAGADGEALDAALVGLVDAAVELGVSWLTVQEPTLGRALLRATDVLAARGIVVGNLTEGEDGTCREAGRLQVLVAPPHSGRAALVAAIERLARAGVAPEKVDERAIGEALGVPDVDLLVVTGGHRTVPDLLLWQIAYSEIVYLDEPWPNDASEALARAVDEYRRRDRRYGGLVASA